MGAPLKSSCFYKSLYYLAVSATCALPNKPKRIAKIEANF